MNKETLIFYVQSLLAGALIGFGDLVYVFNENHILGSFLFSLGLLSILIKGYPLYTGRIGYVETVKDLYKPVGGMLPMVIMFRARLNTKTKWIMCEELHRYCACLQHCQCLSP